MEWLSRLKLDLKVVEEDASNEVLQFEIQISLIYSKFVGLYIIRSDQITIYYPPLSATFCQNPSQRRIISRNPLILDLYLSLSSEIL